MPTTRHVPLESALVRVWRDDTPIGAGFLDGPTQVLTAAHVVADALAIPSDQDPPTDARITVDFPLLAPGQRLFTEIAAWQPPGRGTDVAGLRLLDPPPDGARPLVLNRHGGGLDAPLVMVGFPRGLELGTWVYGRQGGPVATGWVEIDRDPVRQAMLAPGFSGTPVWSPHADAVVGMVGYKVTGAGSKIGYMIPVDTLLTAWPELVDVIECGQAWTQRPKPPRNACWCNWPGHCTMTTSRSAAPLYAKNATPPTGPSATARTSASPSARTSRPACDDGDAGSLDSLLP
jgi:hypothetical protein